MHPMSLLLAAVALTQDSLPSAQEPLRRIRVPRNAISAVAPALVQAHAALVAVMPAMAPSLLRAQAVLAATAPALEPQLLQAGEALAEAGVALTDLMAPDRTLFTTEPPPPHAQQDPADSLYRAARRALNRNDYGAAADLFRRIHERYPRSSYAPDALYWQAFALYRNGRLEDARARLDDQRRRYPQAATRGDAETLATRIDGELARRGDEAAARRVNLRAAPPVGPGPAGTPPRAAGPPPHGAPGHPEDEDDDIRVAALNALLQMDAEQALPILKQVLARRDPGSVTLRRKAIFLVSQKRTPETARILLDAARTDPDPEVRQQAVFWLSQVPSEEAVTALDSILSSTNDPELQDKAVFALSQHRSERAGAILRAYAERRDAPLDTRANAIFWLSQHRGAENSAFLRGLFAKLENEELKEKVLFSLSQMRGEENSRWLLEVAQNGQEGIEIRKKALFWAGQGRAPIADLVALYNQMDNAEMKDQLIFVYSQRRESAAVDKLLVIAKTDTDRELRKKALFWLGQSRDPRVAELLLQIINQP